jgi:hypothetical protein
VVFLRSKTQASEIDAKVNVKFQVASKKKKTNTTAVL